MKPGHYLTIRKNRGVIYLDNKLMFLKKYLPIIIRTALDFHKYFFLHVDALIFPILFFENSQGQQHNTLLSAKISLMYHPLPCNILLFGKQTKMSKTLSDIMVNNVIQVLCCGHSG